MAIVWDTDLAELFAKWHQLGQECPAFSEHLSQITWPGGSSKTALLQVVPALEALRVALHGEGPIAGNAFKKDRRRIVGTLRRSVPRRDAASWQRRLKAWKGRGRHGLSATDVAFVSTWLSHRSSYPLHERAAEGPDSGGRHGAVASGAGGRLGSGGVTEQYNAAVAEKRSAEAELSAVKVPERVSAEDIRQMVQELGDMTAALDQADANEMRSSYEALGLQVCYNHETRSAEVAISPALPGFSVGVRGGTRTLTRCLDRGRY